MPPDSPPPQPVTNWREADWPAVSISVLTYNQRDYVSRALDSILEQRVDFEYEIIVGDDGSTDGTRAVLLDYQRRFPDRIQLILHPRHYEDEVPGRTNNLTNLQNCRGKYTAILDGDDYWTDPDKLQRQYDLLEAHPDVSLSCHDSYLICEHGRTGTHATPCISNRGRKFQTGIHSGDTLADRAQLNIHIGSILFRTRVFGAFPDWFREIIPADYALLLLVTRHGKIHYDAAPRSVYYQNQQGFVNTAYWNRDILARRIEDLELFGREFPVFRTSREQQRQAAWMHLRMLKIAHQDGTYHRTGHHLYHLLRADPGFPLRALGQLLGRTLRRFGLILVDGAGKLTSLGTETKRHSTLP